MRQNILPARESDGLMRSYWGSISVEAEGSETRRDRLRAIARGLNAARWPDAHDAIWADIHWRQKRRVEAFQQSVAKVSLLTSVFGPIENSFELRVKQQLDKRLTSL